MVESTKRKDAVKNFWGKGGERDPLLRITGWMLIVTGVILLLIGLWRDFHNTAQFTARYQDDDVRVTATYGKDAGIPRNAELRAHMVTPETNPDDYDQKVADALSAAGRDAGTVPANAIYNIGFYVGDKEVEPAAPVAVAVQSLEDGFAVGEPVTVVHFGENGAEVISNTRVEEDGSAVFVAEGFSTYAFLQMEEKIIETNDWNKICSGAKESDAEATYQLTDDITANSLCIVKGNITIDLNGQTITYNGKSWEHVMEVENGGSLTITDNVDNETPGKFVASSQPFSLVKVDAGGQMTLNGGILENSKGYHAIQANGGTVVINSGAIQNSGDLSDTGGAIRVQDNGNLTITGGTISGNESGLGGAIYFSGDGNFLMAGGTISKNTAGSNGGGLYFTECTGNIEFKGGTISENEATWHGGGLWFGNCSNISINGETQIKSNIADTGGGLRVENNSKLIINGGTISDNKATGEKAKHDTKISPAASGIGGGIALTQSIVTITGGTISDNTAENGGGGIALRRGESGKVTTVEMSGGTISGNSVTGGQWRYGGGVYLQDYSSFTMTDGLISKNHSIGQGGGIGTDYSGMDNGDEKCTGQIRVEINGGEISGNYSTEHEGGGIGMGNGMLVIEAEPGPVYIKENESQTKEHWGGGGIFISDKAKGVIIGALIENNSAGGFGGGLGACSTGHVFFGNGPENTPLAAIFGNSANGKNLSGTASKKNADHNAFMNEVFMNSGYQDVYSALEAVISGLMLGLGDEAWVGSADGAPVTVNKSGFVSASQMLGLTSNASAEDREKARGVASVFITDNHSNTHGGGIMCNGELALGWSAELDITPGLEIKGTKQYEIKEEKADSVPEFRFALSNGEPSWKEDQWEAAESNSVFYVKNNVAGTFDFDLTFGEMQPCLKKEVGTQTFYFWEVNEGGNDMTYDSALYRVTVNVSETTEEKKVDKAALTINYWKVDIVNVEKCTPDNLSYSVVGYMTKKETNDSTNENERIPDKIARTIITLEGNVFENNYDGDAKLQLKKVDENGNPLKDAEFTLYKRLKNEFKEDNWESDSNAWQKIGTYTSDEEGIIYADNDETEGNLKEGVYRLVETAVPDESYKLLPGYIEFEIKGQDAQRILLCPFNPAFSDYAKVADNGLILQIKNTQAKKSFRIRKVDSAAESGLPEAQFELYSTKERDGKLEKDQKLWTAESGDDGLLHWKKVNNSAEVSSDESGSDTDDSKLTLIAGTYYLYETKAPGGHLGLENPIIITITKEEDITCKNEEVELKTEDGETILTFLLPNTSSFVLPESGGPGTFVYVAAGLLLIFGSVVFLILKRRLNCVR